MLHLLTNPGISPLADLVKNMAFSIVPLMLSLGLGMLVAHWGFSKLEAKKALRNRKTFAILAAIVGTGLMVAVGCVASIGIFQQSQQLAKYDSSVASWLDTGYGIKANADIAHRLTHGETFTVTYHGQEIVISVIENINGNLSVVDQNHTVLEPTE